MQDFFVKKLYEDAIVPTQAHPGDAGWDLYAYESATIPAQSMVKVGTGISIALPENTFGAIYARSGLATKQGLRLQNCVGICDSGYRGEYIIALYNDSMQERRIEKGDRIAQLVIQEYVPTKMNIVEDLDATERGATGFGASGR